MDHDVDINWAPNNQRARGVVDMRTSFTTWVAVHSFGIFAMSSAALGLGMGVADLMHIQQYEAQHSMASGQEAM